MRLSPRLCAQHIGRMIKRHWYIQNKQKIVDTGAAKALEGKGIEIVDGTEFLNINNLDIIKKEKFDVSVLEPLIPVLEEPLEKQDKICYFQDDHNFLVEGQSQAQIITKTVLIENKLPDRIEQLVEESQEEVENLIKRIIRTATIFNAYQEKLPIKKDPNRPTWVFPRDYGITAIRKTDALFNKLFRLCELLSGPEVANNRKMVHNGIVSLPFEKDSDTFQFKMTLDLMITTNEPLKQFYDKNVYKSTELPSLYPVHYTVSLAEEEYYKLQDLYPIDPKHENYHTHTIFISYDPTVVKNLTELPVQETQILSRSLIKSFTAAASCARQRFGSFVKNLPEPVSVQCILSDGKSFHFSVFQLNTLNLNGTDGIKNYWWSLPRMDLYEKSQYEIGKPVLEGYNPEVFKRILAFYKNM